ncbi:MAG: formylmethanofuran dehydrogenase subunit B [Promethearchaeia archaeon]
MQRVPCSGCSLLCDDIIIRSDGLFIDEVIGACLKGKERFDQCTAKNRITKPKIRISEELKDANLEDAIKKAVEIIKNSKKPLLYGFSNSSCEAQLKGIELAKKINGFIDSNSIICHGRTLNAAKSTGITLSTLSEVINKADLIVFWGANPAESIPRLLNKTLFSRGKFRMTGREIKTLIIIDPVKTASFNTMGVRDLALQIEQGKDYELIKALKEECCVENAIPPEGVAGLDANDMKRLLIQLSSAEYGVIFLGQGILKKQGEIDLLKEILELVELINEKQMRGRISVITMGGHYNMIGFEHIALSSTGKNHSLQFENGKLTDSEDTIISKIEKDDFDCSIIVGTDPLSHLPFNLAEKLIAKPIILIDNKKNLTYNFSDVFIPSAITGVECGGLAYRLDHIPIQLKKIINPPSNVLSDEEILNKIIIELNNQKEG